jgi:hypothetical protein
MVAIFKNMYDGRELLAAHEYRELRRMLLEAIERGFVEQVPQLWTSWSADEVWYRACETGEIYALTAPGERSFGHWNRVDFQDQLFPRGPLS